MHSEKGLQGAERNQSSVSVVKRDLYTGPVSDAVFFWVRYPCVAIDHSAILEFLREPWYGGKNVNESSISNRVY